MKYWMLAALLLACPYGAKAGGYIGADVGASSDVTFGVNIGGHNEQWGLELGVFTNFEGGGDDLTSNEVIPHDDYTVTGTRKTGVTTKFLVSPGTKNFFLVGGVGLGVATQMAKSNVTGWTWEAPDGESWFGTAYGGIKYFAQPITFDLGYDVERGPVFGLGIMF